MGSFCTMTLRPKRTLIEIYLSTIRLYSRGIQVLRQRGAGPGSQRESAVPDCIPLSPRVNQQRRGRLQLPPHPPPATLRLSYLQVRTYLDFRPSCPWGCSRYWCTSLSLRVPASLIFFLDRCRLMIKSVMDPRT